MASTSPFPGMDPYLEWYWGDVHTSLAIYARDQLNSRLAPGLVARAQERVYVESPLSEPRGLEPDVHVYEHPRPRGGSPGGVAVLSASAEPYLIHVPAVEVTEPYIEIHDARSGGVVVTVIEFVSRSNKSTKTGRRQYRQKQQDVVASETNLVEIDLLRGGRGVTLASSATVPVEAQSAYHASVRRGVKPTTLEYYPLKLRDRLPAIRIPLRPGDTDVQLDLQALVSEAYQKGRYAETIDYAKPPRPALKGDDLAWATELLAQRK